MSPLTPCSVLALVLATGCAAQPPGYPAGNYVPEWKVVGLGTSRCSDFLASADDRAARETYRQWFLGYLTAINVGARATANVIDTRHLNWTDNVKIWSWEEWLTQLCKSNPGYPFHLAVRDTVSREFNEMWKQERRESGEFFPM